MQFCACVCPQSLPKCLLSNTALEELDVRDNNELADAPPYLLRDEEAAGTCYDYADVHRIPPRHACRLKHQLSP
jgi:hypothetical protein